MMASFRIELLLLVKIRESILDGKRRASGHHLNLRAGDQQRPEYLKLNSNAVVPTLVDNGTVIEKSTVICEYLDEISSYAPTPPARLNGNCNAKVRSK
jgi:glutathione S-transferase